MKLYGGVKPSEGGYVLRPVAPDDIGSILIFVKEVEITEKEIGSLYKVIKIAEEERFSCGVDDDPDIFNAHILLRKLTGIDGDLSKLKGDE